MLNGSTMDQGWGGFQLFRQKKEIFNLNNPNKQRTANDSNNKEQPMTTTTKTATADSSLSPTQKGTFLNDKRMLFVASFSNPLLLDAVY